MDKKYIIDLAVDRILMLKKRYEYACKDLSEFGEPIPHQTAATYRNSYKKDIELCTLMLDLIGEVEGESIELSPKSFNGILKLVSPFERHRRKKQNVQE